MIITVTVDSAAWEAGLDNLLGLLDDASREASLKGAEEIRDVAREGLVAKEHDEFTYSPAGAGEFPASVSGALADSMTAELFGDEAWVGPTNLPYARIQELGGPMPVTRPGPMHYRKLGPRGLAWITRDFVQLDPRPYLEPSTNLVVDSGRLDRNLHRTVDRSD